MAKDNVNISSTYSGWIDLFGWGTSGWNSGAIEFQPYSTSKNNTDYYPGASSESNLTDNYVNSDWGVYNKISNGGNKANMWRTLTQNEWEYLINSRPSANKLYSQGKVEGLSGLIILPDDWDTPSSVQFVYQAGNWNTNSYSIEDWNLLQSYGAVFLPASGGRGGVSLSGVGTYGHYWSTSNVDGNYAYGLGFGSNDITTNAQNYRYGGQSIRLVQDVK